MSPESNNITAIIIDDEPHAIKTITGLLEKYADGVEVIATATNALQGIKTISSMHPDVVFLDVNMPGGSGIDMLEALPKREFSVVFTTASADFAIQALKNFATDYLLKPIDIDELIVAVEKVRKQRNKKNTLTLSKLALPTLNGVKLIAINDIIYIEASDNYTHFFIDGEKNKLTISKTLKDFEEQLDSEQFCRIHQSYIINFNYLDTYIRGRGGQVVMKNGAILEVSARKKDDLLKKLLH